LCCSGQHGRRLRGGRVGEEKGWRGQDEVEMRKMMERMERKRKKKIVVMLMCYHYKHCNVH